MDLFLENVASINGIINNFIWGPIMLALLVGTGLYFTVRTGFFQVRKFGYVMKNTIIGAFSKKNVQADGEGDVSSFAALTTALAATVGTGNIAGVAGAIAVGGPGAIFWMWVCAFLGMMTKYAEILLAVKYREVNDKGEYSGGPMYYIEKGLNQKWLAILFSIFAVLASFGIGCGAQANTIATSLQSSFGIPTIVTGVVVAILAAFVIIGGIKRIASVTEKLVPIMAVFYILAALLVIIINYQSIIPAFSMIFTYAFTPAAATGGFVGATIMLAMQKGMARGVFSNEAGLGSAPIAHATAKTSHPTKQAMWGIFEVFIDTIIICSLTALVILTSGVFGTTDAAGKLLTGAPLTLAAFSESIHSFAGVVLAVAIFCFAFSTIISWNFYGSKCLEYLAGSSKYTFIYKLAFLFIVVVASVSDLSLVWDIADTLNGFMAIPNLIALLFLSPVVFVVTKDFFDKQK